MRTTLTLEDDVAALLKQELRRSGEPLKQTVNRLLRSGLSQHTSSSSQQRFKVKPHDLNLPAEWTSGSTQELLDMLEGGSLG